MAKLDRILDRYDMKTLEAAVTRRRARDKQLAAASARRREVEAELAKLNVLMDDGAARGRRGRKTALERKPNAQRLNDITLAEALEKVMRARTKPANYKELTDTVLKRGMYRTKSKNLLSTVAVTLKRDARFRKVKPGFWALKK